MASWAVITGAGTGIGCALVKALASKGFQVLAVGRRLEPLVELQKHSPCNIHVLSTDIATDAGIELISNSIPSQDNVRFLVQNAAVGLPSILKDIKREDFEYALSVNVTAPLFLSQKFLGRLSISKGRILHIGTGVAFKAQLGTTTYGLSKMAFHRLYEQLKVELEGTGVFAGSASPGVVDTEGLAEHIKLAKFHGLPHVSYFERVFASHDYSSVERAARFLCFMLLEMSNEEFSRKEWHINDPEIQARWEPSTS